jgi:hypothetical protein
MNMRPVTHQNLGVVIAYLLPGFLVLWSLSLSVPTIGAWLSAPADGAPTIGGFFYATLTSLGLGILVNMVRALVVDPLHHQTGVTKRDWSYAVLQQHIAAIEFLVVHQFRYYQFAGNMLLAVLVSYVAVELQYVGWSPWLFVLVAVVELLLWFGSRSHLRTYYIRLGEILGGREGELGKNAEKVEELAEIEPTRSSGSDLDDSVGSPAPA